MAPSKKWMNFVNDRLNEKYKAGVVEFLDYAFSKMGEVCEIRCPCVKCNNTDKGSREVVAMHLNVYGIMPNYIFWYHHGERRGETESSDEEVDENESEEEINEVLQDFYPDYYGFDKSGKETGSSSRTEQEDKPNEDADAFYRLLKDVNQPTYPGCETSKLSALVKLLHIKSIGRWSNESFDMLLKMLKEILPTGSTLPETYYDSKKIIRDLGLSYEKIDVCVNNCMLYWKDAKQFDVCSICGVSRWKEDCRSGETKIQKNGKKVSTKTMRYFPLKPRLQRLFMSRKTASDMRWHHESRVDDGVLRHPADSLAWKSFDETHKEFSSEPRNVRLGLASDGFQPFSHSQRSYSIWPVILIPYNMPPWICMKESNLILSMLIPGPEGPGDAIDVYLRPLIEELRELWEVGVDTFDASTHKNFRLHASLLWTINDFPAYGNLSGWSTKGKLACPCCNKDTYSMRLAKSNKQCFMGHRCYLPTKHKWRKDTNSFDGTTDLRSPPKSLSGSDVLAQVHDLEGIILTRDRCKKMKISHKIRGDNWNKKSVFFDLPYWSTLLLRHNLDVMHIEKNVCDNIIGTIMSIKGKSKDNLQARLDLEMMGIRPDLHPVRIGDKLELPVAAYTLSKEEKHLFCLFLKKLKVPDGFSSNISQCVNMKEHKFLGLKSHDCHILLQHLLPIGIRGLLPKSVCEPLIELSLFFTSLCAKTLSVDELEQIGSQIPITLCKLEQVFLPSFFDIMVHLPVHLANEAKIGGNKNRKVRGGNKNRKVASLRSGEKLEVIFFNNRPVNKNHEAWSRHLGKIVRDNNICPVRVQSWKEIGNAEKQHMWEAVKECFSNPNIELYREHTLEHMSVLWGAWRSKLYADHVKPYKNKINALKKVPRGMNDKDWEWLVTNKFLTKEFQDISERNSKNRSKSDLFMPHLTGSRPHREIIYDKGGKNSEMPDLGVIFFETRSKNGKFKGTKEKDKYDEIVETIQSNPSLGNLELAEKCFGPQRHGIVYGYGGGVKRKTFHDWKSSYTKELEEKLSAKDEENRLLRKRVDRLEERFDQWERSGLPSEQSPHFAE